jgi:hypothetical protein
MIDRILKPLVDKRMDDAIESGEFIQRAQDLGVLAPASPTPRSMFFDPMSLVSQTNYKERMGPVTYEVLYNMAMKTEVVNAILNTRLAQIGSFSQPARWKNKTGLGFQIRFKDPKREPTKAEEQRLAQLEEVIYHCGYTDIYRSGERRPNFGEFLRRFLRDSLIYDQACFEVVPNRLGEPCEWWPVDGATIRLAQPNMQNFNVTDGRDIVKYVQVYNNVMRHTYTYKEMAFCVRNGDTNIKRNGYGVSELETLINLITSILFAEEYNKRWFSQGQMINGILNLKSANLPQEQLEGFRRQWQTLASGVTNAHKVPVLSVKDGVDFVNFHSSNRDMEYSNWIEFLVKMVTGVYLIDPAEVNFDYRGASESAPLFETSPEAKLKHSRDKGLRNLLNFIEEKMNFHIVQEVDSDLFFEFVGIDMKDEQEIVNIRSSEVQAYKTLNEVRKEASLEPLKPEQGGDLIANAVVVNYLLQQQQMEQQQQAGEQGAPQGDPADSATHAEGFGEDETHESVPAGGKQPQKKPQMPTPIRNG